MSKREKSKGVPIDKQKFKDALKAKGTNATRVSEEVGYSSNYIASWTCESPEIPMTISKYLEYAYGIKPEEYAPEQSQLPDEDTVIAGTHLSQSQIEKSIMNVLDGYQPIDYERMYKIIYSAVNEAVKMALTE